MRAAAGRILLAAVLSCFHPSPAPGACGTEVERALALAADGKKWFDTAGQTDLPTADRNKARKAAYPLLREASTILETWCDAHPDDAGNYEDRMVEINRDLFWLRKESPMGLLDEFMRKPGSGAAPSAPSAPNAPAPTAPAPTAPDAPPPPAAAPPPPPGPFAAAAAFEKAHPFDEAGSLDQWLEALAADTDRGSEEHRRALDRVSLLSERLKEYYRKIRNEDPDALDPEKDPGRAAQVAAKAAEGLASPDPAARRAAAGELASLGWSPAGLTLYEALRREKDAGVREALLLALVRLGGRRACENLARFAKEKDPDLAGGSVRSLAAIAGKGPVQARYAARALGEFPAENRVAAASSLALEELRRMGKSGVAGLVRAADTKDATLEVAVLGALGDAGDPSAAPTLCERLDDAKVPPPRLEAAKGALVKIGKPSIPALIEALKKAKTRRNAGVLLYDISGGQTFGEDPRAWSEWWKTQK